MILQDCSYIPFAWGVISDVIRCCYHHCVSHRRMSHHRANRCCMNCLRH